MTLFGHQSFLLHIFSGSFGLQTNNPVEWLVLFFVLAWLATEMWWFRRAGRRELGDDTRTLKAVGAGMAKRTGLAPWAAVGVLLGLWSLTTAFIGFMWDVAWHADLGRDRELFTVPHTLILLGLAGIGVSALASIVFASRERANVVWRFRRYSIPAGAGVMLALSAAGLVAFPLDDLWHATYGIDVTMWSPTHLVMIGGASLTPLALALLLWESRPAPQRSRMLLQTVVMGTVLVGLSTFQLEFDMGIPQWQQLFHPLLIALAAGFTLTASRQLLGQWGALKVALLFIAMRGLVSLFIGPILGHTLSHFPLYLVEALCVESAFMLLRGSFARSVVSGALIGTVGIAAEWLWMQVWGLQPWGAELLPMMWLPALMAVLASVIGMSFALNIGAPERSVTFLPRAVALACIAGVAVLLAIPMPRDGSNATVRITTWQVSKAVTALDRNGVRATTFDIAVNVQVSPPDAPAGADWFRVADWQGGGIVNANLIPVGNGTYVASRSVPVGGDWKAMVYLAHGSTLAAAPIEMPAEPDQGLSAIPLQATRTAQLGNAQLMLLRENHSGGAWVADLAYAIFGTTLIVWLGLLSTASRRLARRSGPVRPARKVKRGPFSNRLGAHHPA